MDPEEYRKNLEREIILIIQIKLERGEMSAERAQAIARLVLQKLHPPLTLEQIHQIAPTLDDEFIELAKAVLPVVADHQKEVERIVIDHSKKLIQSGRFEEATRIMQQASSQKTG